MIIFKIRGRVREEETGIGLPGLFVKAYDADLLYDDLMGSTYTAADGSFEIVSELRDFRDFFETRPDIYLRIFAPDAKTEIYTTEDAVRWDAGRIEEFDVMIPREALGELIPERGIRFVDPGGERRKDFDVGESLVARLEGLPPDTPCDIAGQALRIPDSSSTDRAKASATGKRGSFS